MLTRLARLAIRRRRLVIGGWVALLVVGFVVGGSVFGRLETTGLQVPDGSESVRASRLLVTNEKARGPEIVAVYDGVRVDDPAFVAEVQRVAAQLRATPGVASVLDHVSTGSPQMVASDGRAAALVVELGRVRDPMAHERTVRSVTGLLRSVAAPTVLVTSDEQMDEEFGDQAEKDLQRAELLSFPVLLVFLVLLFGGVVTAGLPLIVAMVALAGTLLILLGLSHVAHVSVFSINVASMLGLGLAVDYGLLLVSRFREERVSAEPFVAIERTMATAGRTVVFSGLTVVVALSGLLVYSDSFLRSMAAGGMAVSLVGVVAAITLMPALLASLNRRIRPASRRSQDHGVFAALARTVQRRAVPIVLVVAAG
ncbi:MAG: MMPL family transporter, partial [Actinomycetota bacterium]|nr:MMPL family transporter [Actinomycetota bacterium]